MATIKQRITVQYLQWSPKSPTRRSSVAILDVIYQIMSGPSFHNNNVENVYRKRCSYCIGSVQCTVHVVCRCSFVSSKYKDLVIQNWGSLLKIICNSCFVHLILPHQLFQPFGWIRTSYISMRSIVICSQPYLHLQEQLAPSLRPRPQFVKNQALSAFVCTTQNHVAVWKNSVLNSVPDQPGTVPT